MNSPEHSVSSELLAAMNHNFMLHDSWEKLSGTLKQVFFAWREVVSWGSYGKDGKQPRKEILIKDLSDLHICAILETQHHIKGTPTEWLLRIEQSYRKEKGIEVKEP